MLCQLCKELCHARSCLPHPVTRLYGTWSRYKYHHNQILNWVNGLAISGAQCPRSYLASCLIPSTRGHSTETSQAIRWKQPKGYDTKITVYNPLVKEKVPLILLHEKLAHWYACGPTVYDSAHIGHASSYVRLDIIRRILSSVFGIDTLLVMGVTDVDDKIINKSKQTGQTLNELTRFYEAEFFASLAKLNVVPPYLLVRVTDHIPQVINFILGIEKKGLAYKTPSGSVYFDVAKYGGYGVFSNMHHGRTQEVDLEKRSAQDFALWKASKPAEPFWQSPWGNGRPGWHIECSAMASHIFGSCFDLHTGGEDLIFPHHENELAQSCAFHDSSQWVNYWIHTGHLFLSGQTEKMSKSLKNVITVSEFLEDYTSSHFRMLCLLNNYRNRIEFSFEHMQKAVSTTNALNNIISLSDLYVKGQIECGDVPEADLYEKLHSTRETVEAALADDFNTPRALAHIIRLVKWTNQLLGGGDLDDKPRLNVRSSAPVAAVSIYIQRFLNQLGLDLDIRKKNDESEAHLHFSKAIDTVVSTRTKIRHFAKDKQFLIASATEVGIPEDQAVRLMKKLYKPLWDISDRIRADVLSAANVQISDNAVSSSWSIVDHKKKSDKSPTNETIKGSSEESKTGEFINTKDEEKSKFETPI